MRRPEIRATRATNNPTSSASLNALRHTSDSDSLAFAHLACPHSHSSRSSGSRNLSATYLTVLLCLSAYNRCVYWPQHLAFLSEHWKTSLWFKHASGPHSEQVPIHIKTEMPTDNQGRLGAHHTGWRTGGSWSAIGYSHAVRLCAVLLDFILLTVSVIVQDILVDAHTRCASNISRAKHAQQILFERSSLDLYLSLSTIFLPFNFTLHRLVSGNLNDTAGTHMASCMLHASHSLDTNTASWPLHDHEDFGRFERPVWSITVRFFFSFLSISLFCCAWRIGI
jgi:hypothetical protein